MVDFRKLRESKALPLASDPIEIFRRLPKPPGINDLYNSQAQVLSDWYKRRSDRDVVIKLHTGGGKTLVGLLIAQSTLNEFREPVLYLCATTQLVDQTISKAQEYGISAVPYVSGQGLPDAFTASNAVLVATYQALFNGRSRFGVRGGSREIVHVGAIILDDAHVSFANVRDQFTLSISKAKSPEFYAELAGAFRADFNEIGRVGTFDDVVAGSDYTVLEIPYWAWLKRFDGVLPTIRQANDQGLEWPLVRDGLRFCHALLTRDEFVISPIFPFVDLLPTFSDCQRRVFMSATIADDSALVETFDADPSMIEEALTSTSLAGVAERMILVPELMPQPIADLRSALQKLATWAAEKQQKGTVILAPSGNAAATWSSIATIPASSQEVTTLVKALQEQTNRGPIAFANRYDGIDLPQDACRLLIVDGLPRGASAYDQYRANVFLGGSAFNTALAQRIEQGIGRAARGGGDYCAIVLIGRDLVAWLGRESNQRLLTDSTRAQLEIGFEISRSIDSATEFARTVLRCFERDKDWIEYHAEQLADLSSVTPPRNGELRRAAASRRAFRLARDGYYDKAVEVITDFERSSKEDDAPDEQTRGWLCEFAARIAATWGRDDLAGDLQKRAYGLNRNLSRPRSAPPYSQLPVPGSQAKAVTANLGAFRARRGYLAEFDENVSFLVSGSSSNQFEEALKNLGSALGFAAERPERTYGVGPDVLWLLNSDHGLVIEAKSRKNKSNALTKEQHGQLLNADEWFKREYPGKQSIRVSVHPNASVSRSTVPGASRALTLSALSMLVSEARQMLAELCSSSLVDDQLAIRCEELLRQHGVTPDLLIERFLVPFDEGT